jgi:hypothetical protein
MTLPRKVLALLGFMIVALSAGAQDTLKIKISSGSDETDQQMRSIILPEVSANPHFTLVSDSSWDVELLTSCVAPTSGGDHTVLGVACAYSIMYGPNKFGGFTYMLLPSSVDVGPDVASVAQAVFSDVLDYTTVDQIKTADTTLGGAFNDLWKLAISTVKPKPCVLQQKSGQTPKGQ